MRPLENLFVRANISPNAITLIGLATTTLSAFFLASGHLIIGGWSLFIAGSFDFLDGRVARITGQQSQSGAFFDSVMDRYMDSATLFALAYLFWDSWVVVFVFLAILGTGATSYIRAKAESLKISCDGGAMQRPERIVYFGTGAALSGYLECLRFPFMEAGWQGSPFLLIIAVAFVGLGSNKVAIERFRDCFRQLKSKEQSGS